MKRTSILLYCVVLSMLFFSCTSKTVKTEEKDLKKKIYLDKDTTRGGLSLDIEVEIPSAFADTAVLKSIRQSVINSLFGQQYSALNGDVLLQKVAQDYESTYLRENRPLLNTKDTTNSYSFNNDQTVLGYSLLSDKKIYVYGIERSVDMGGEHENQTRVFLNFNLSNGKIITEKDLFKPGYEKALAQLIKQRILEYCKAEPQEKNAEPIESLDDTDYWVDDIKPNANFYITDEGINYVFNPYEIGPYGLGQTEVVLKYKELKPILKPSGIVSYLVEKDALISQK